MEGKEHVLPRGFCEERFTRPGIDGPVGNGQTENLVQRMDTSSKTKTYRTQFNPAPAI